MYRDFLSREGSKVRRIRSKVLHEPIFSDLSKFSHFLFSILHKMQQLPKLQSLTLHARISLYLHFFFFYPLVQFVFTSKTRPLFLDLENLKKKKSKTSCITAKIIFEASLISVNNIIPNILLSVLNTSSLMDSGLEENFTSLFLVKFCRAHTYLQSRDNL